MSAKKSTAGLGDFSNSQLAKVNFATAVCEGALVRFI